MPAHFGADPFTGDIWQVALLELPVNATRHWPATEGTIDLRVIEPGWLREIVRHWARDTRPNLQRLRETLRACQAASRVLTTAGCDDPAGWAPGTSPASWMRSAPSGAPTGACTRPATAT